MESLNPYHEGICMNGQCQPAGGALALGSSKNNSKGNNDKMLCTAAEILLIFGIIYILYYIYSQQKK